MAGTLSGGVAGWQPGPCRGCGSARRRRGRTCDEKVCGSTAVQRFVRLRNRLGGLDRLSSSSLSRNAPPTAAVMNCRRPSHDAN
ncbi:hypothetical protein FOMPIDRAFT_120906 [Fomitopsis schrenkii]|uniref:Uncharacterized protein n=1 Tax=Fomitopsis schrenkii TaxID=2126942 RepID=S8EEC9_FOMSC|nr:hypothetical protein FOMPIDRAFT_120906 [Fomitopsis schrenkii]